jgi:hypothetical protein
MTRLNAIRGEDGRWQKYRQIATILLELADEQIPGSSMQGHQISVQV